MVDCAIILALASLPLFWRLGGPPIYLWDEARVAINAVEMTHAHNALVTTFHGQPDLWNTKPPLAVWLSALSMKAFGLNEFALRLPSALAALATVFLVYAFTRRVSESRLAGVLASAILLGTGGYVEIHVARTADYDSLLVLMTTAATFCLFNALQALQESPRRTAWWFQAAALAQFGAVLTKGIAAFLLAPGYALYLLWSGEIRPALSSRSAWVALAVLAGLTIIYFSLREAAGPGFAQVLWKTDIADRFTTGGEHRHAWYYYVAGLIAPWPIHLSWLPNGDPYTQSAFPWSWLLPICTVLAIRSRRPSVSRAAIYLLCCLAGFLLAISLAATKIQWYVAPAYPLIAVLTALGIQQFAKLLGATDFNVLRRATPMIMPAAVAAGILCAFVSVYKAESETRQASAATDLELPWFVRWIAQQHLEFTRVRVVSSGIGGRTPAVINGQLNGAEPYNGQEEFYAAAMRERGADVQIVGSDYVPKPGEVILGCGPEFKATHRLRPIVSHGRCIAGVQSPG